MGNPIKRNLKQEMQERRARQYARAWANSIVRVRCLTCGHVWYGPKGSVYKEYACCSMPGCLGAYRVEKERIGT